MAWTPTLQVAALFAWWALLAPADATEKQGEVSLKPERPLKEGALTGRATLSIDNRSVRFGDKIRIKVRFQSKSGGTFYNPDFNGLISPSAQLALFDENKQFKGDLLSKLSGSQRFESTGDWQYVRPKGSIESEIDRTIPAKSLNYGELAPGNYYLQLIYNGLFTFPSPRHFGPLTQGERQTMMQIEESDLFRSNVVEFTLKGEQ